MGSVLDQPWFAKPNDEIGGWCVMPTDKTPLEGGGLEVANFTTEEAARHIADLHNKWLFGQQQRAAYLAEVAQTEQNRVDDQ